MQGADRTPDVARTSDDVVAALSRREAQQAAVAHLGQVALGPATLQNLCDGAVDALARHLGVELTKVLVSEEGQTDLVLIAGVGWNEDVDHCTLVPTGVDSQAGYTLKTTEPVIVGDLRTESRFTGPALLTDHGVVSGLSVIIGSKERPFGVLGAHTRDRRTFSQDDVNFLQAVANILADAMARELADIEIRNARARLDTILDTASDAIITTDDSLVVEIFNRKAEAAFGCSAEEMVGSALDARLPQIAELVRDLRSRTAGDPTATAEYETSHNGSPQATYELGLSEAHRDGAVSLTLIMRDITERKAGELQLLEVIRSKDEFVASVSHELRTPLAAVVGMSHVLRDDFHTLSPAEQAEFAATIATQSNEVSNIVEDLLVVARSDIGGVTVNHNAVSLAKMFRQTLASLPSPVPEFEARVPEDVSVIGDEIRIKQVLRNLLTNAIRHGGTRCGIEVTPVGDMAQIDVWDNGPGIPEDRRERIFEAYERGTERTTTTASVGLGLTVSRNLVRLMGGDLTYRLEAGRSIFRTTLPLSAAQG